MTLLETTVIGSKFVVGVLLGSVAGVLVSLLAGPALPLAVTGGGIGGVVNVLRFGLRRR